MTNSNVTFNEAITYSINWTADSIQSLLSSLFQLLLIFTTEIFTIFSADIQTLSPTQIELFSLIAAIFLFFYLLGKTASILVGALRKLENHLENQPTKQPNKETAIGLRKTELVASKMKKMDIKKPTNWTDTTVHFPENRQ